MKICRDCGEEKILDEFINNRAFSGGKDTLCKECNRLRVKSWRKSNPEKRKLQAKRESGSDKIYNRRKHLKANYGITVEDYDAMYEAQQGYCDICKIHQSETPKKFHVDHCHTTGKIRGLLCPECNHLLGRARDTRSILQNAISYLDKTQTGY